MIGWRVGVSPLLANDLKLLKDRAMETQLPAQLQKLKADRRRLKAPVPKTSRILGYDY
jgi:hypothetical protein